MVCPAGGLSRAWLGIGQGIPQSCLLMAQMDLTRVPSHVCAAWGRVWLGGQGLSQKAVDLCWERFPHRPNLWTSWRGRFKDETGFSGLAQVDAGLSPPP